MRTTVAGFGRILSVIGCPWLHRGITDGPPEVLDRQGHVERIGGRGLESGVDALVEGSSLGRFGMDEQRAHADALGDRRDLEEDIPNERRANASSLLAEMNAEAGKDH